MGTFRFVRVAAVLACAALVLVGCGDGDDAADTTAPAADENGSDSDTDDSDDEPAVLEIEGERVADLGAFRIDRAVSTGDAIVGQVANYGEDNGFSTSLVSVGLDGTVSAPVPVPDNVSIFDLFSTSAGVFVSGSSRGETSACGYAPLDVATLTVGLVVDLFTSENSCGTTSKLIEGSTVAMVYRDELSVVDTATGEVRTTAITTAGDDTGFRSSELFDLGDAYLVSTSSTSEDGVEGLTTISRVDPVTLEVTAQGEATGSISVVGEQIWASEFAEANADGTMDEPTVVAFDPVTLTTTPQAERPDRWCPAARTGAVVAADLVWTTGGTTDDGSMVVSGYDPDSCQVAVSATLPTLEGQTDDTNVYPQVFAAGDDVYVISTLSEPASEIGTPPLATVLDRIVVG